MNRMRLCGLLTAGLAASLASPALQVAHAADAQPPGNDVEAIDWDRYEVGRPRTWRVRCNQGATIGRTLRRVRPGDTLIVTGLCEESFVLTKDRVRLIGEGGATIDGGTAASEAVVTIDGARGVVLESLTVRNGADQGILGTHQAQFFLRDLVVSNHGTVGVSVDRSHVEIDGLTLTGNQSTGLDAYAGSTVLLQGTVTATRNGGDGLAANGKTYLELRGATVNASDNAGSGVSAINDSRLQILSFPEAQGSSITADGNGSAGIALLGSELGVVGSQYFGSGANVLRTTNNFAGFLVLAGAILSPHATARFVAEDNFVGMLMEDDASALIVGGLTLGGNDTGLDADGAGTLQFVSVPPNPSQVVDNRQDIDLSFGTRATIVGVETGTVACDASVLLRGTLDIRCPHP